MKLMEDTVNEHTLMKNKQKELLSSTMGCTASPITDSSISMQLEAVHLNDICTKMVKSDGNASKA
jgi:hypothetical protein